MKREAIPVDFVFNPNWWFQECGISFDESFYLDTERRIENDRVMRRTLFERFGLEESDPVPRPILGSMHVAGGFVIPALFGAEIRFAENQAPYAVPLELTRDQVMRLEVPDVENRWPLKQLLDQAQDLSRRFGYVLGDLNTDGILNTALCLRGQPLFLDFYDDPGLVNHLTRVVAETICRVASRITEVSGSASIAVNRSIVHVDSRIFLNANCSLHMVSPALYESQLLPAERILSSRMRPYGVHHCGDNCHLFADFYAELGAVFVDVGAGSDIRTVRKALPEAFLNLRLKPTDLLTETAEYLRGEVNRMIRESEVKHKTGVCCVNMEYGTPDENVAAVIDAARNHE
ncbi:MAG: uroporphyrinogen decarboxylase family protein [Acidobacteriota bacterium]